jgi:serine/threonine protein kinase
MPFVEGESLRQRLEREGQLPVQDTIEIVKAVSSALSYAHHAPNSRLQYLVDEARTALRKLE